MDRKKKTHKLDNNERGDVKPITSVLRDLIKDPTLLKQRKILEEVQKILEKANENERKLNAKCMKLQSEIAANESKIRAAIQLSEEDKNTIDTLREELEKAWKTADELRLAHSRNSEISHSLNDDRLSRKDMSRNSVLSLQTSLSNCDKSETSQKQSEAANKILQNELKTQKKTSERLKSEIKQLQLQIQSANSVLDEKNKKIEQLQTNLKVLENLNSDREQEDQHALFNEIETSKLQIFELEEELTNKEKLIEELTRDSNLKASKLEKMEKELMESNKVNKLFSEKRNTTKCLKEIVHNEQNSNKCSNKKHKNLEKQINRLIIKSNEMVVKLNLLQFKLDEKVNLIYTIQNDNSTLSSVLHTTSKMYDELSAKYDVLKDETNKKTKTIRELENIRNKHVSVLGVLETQKCDLKKELAAYEHCNYPEKINTLENEILITKADVEKIENSLENASQELSRIRRTAVEHQKTLSSFLHMIDSAHVVYNTNTRTPFERSNSVTVLEDNSEIENLAFKLEEKIVGLLEHCQELMIEKYKLYDEIEYLKNNSKISDEKKETEQTEIEVACSETEQNRSKGTSFSMDNENIVNTDNCTISDAKLDYKEENQELGAEREEINSFKYETYISRLKNEGSHTDLKENEQHSSSQNLPSEKDFDISSSAAEPEQNSEIRFSSYENLSSESEVQDTNSNILTTEEATVSHRKITKRNRSIPEVVSSHDLVKYRSQLRLKQKTLDLMALEINSNSSSFNVNSDIYRKGYLKKESETFVREKI